MAVDGRLDQLSADYHSRLMQLEAPYLRAKEYVGSEKFNDDQSVALAKIKSILSGPPKTAEMALYLVGKVDQLLDDIYAWERVITEYESIKRTLSQMYPDKK